MAGMGVFLFLGVAAVAGYGLFRTVRGQAADRRYLAEAGEEEPLHISHLSRGLQQLAKDARALRLAMEGPIRELASLSAIGAIGADTDSLDRQLLAASREMGDFIRASNGLSEQDVETLHDLGAETGPLQAEFEALGYAFERQGNPRPLSKRMVTIATELRRLEDKLQAQRNPYR